MKWIFLTALLLTALTKTGWSSDFTSFIGMEFVTIPSGVFYMGSCLPPEGKAEEKVGLFGLGSHRLCPSGGSLDLQAEEDEMPQHRVSISKAFQMGVHEVTAGQFNKYLEKAGKTVSVNYTKSNSYGDRAAVTWVSWFQAQEFADWLNREKPVSDDGLYRLPTEAEWEYATRAGSSDPYFFGEDVFQISRFAWTIKDSQGLGLIRSKDVGMKRPNPWGLYDVYGNVWEWVHDIYHKDTYKNSPEVDPKGPETGLSQVLRGGSLYSSAKNCRSAKRYFLPADQRDGTVGFRLVRELP